MLGEHTGSAPRDEQPVHVGRNPPSRHIDLPDRLARALKMNYLHYLALSFTHYVERLEKAFSSQRL
jgi:hypothetical protein